MWPKAGSNLLKKGHKCDVLVPKSCAELFQKLWGVVVKVAGNVINGMRKILDAIGNPAIILIVQYFIYFELNEHTRFHYLRDVFFFHPCKPFQFNILINTNGNVIQKHIVKLSYLNS